MTLTEPAAPDTVLRPTTRSNTPWADELAKWAAAMWRSGSSARVIGDAIGRTRNAVVGKMNRMGLQRSHKIPPAPYCGDSPARRYAQKKRAPWVNVVDVKPEITPTAVSIIELERHHCRWPASGEGAAMLYCGGAAMNGFPYCPRHCRMAYQRAPR